MINIEKKKNGKIEVNVTYFPKPIIFIINRENYKNSFYKIQKLLQVYEYSTCNKKPCKIIKEVTKIINDCFNNFESMNLFVTENNKIQPERKNKTYKKKNLKSGTQAIENLIKYFSKK